MAESSVAGLPLIVGDKDLSAALLRKVCAMLSSGHFIGGENGISQHLKVEHGALLKWIMSDIEREKEYRDALRIGAHVHAEEIVIIADLEGDIQAKKLQIEARKLLIKHHAPLEYGENKDAPAPGLPNLNIENAAFFLTDAQLLSIIASKKSVIEHDGGGVT